MEIADNFCYLGDMIQKDGRCDKAVRDRVRKGWLKFRELGRVLCNRRIALKMRGVLSRKCVRCGCESWPLRKENEENLVRAERRLIRMMCGVTLVNREKSKDL